jgi:hypothetical protein
MILTKKNRVVSFSFCFALIELMEDVCLNGLKTILLDLLDLLDWICLLAVGWP